MLKVVEKQDAREAGEELLLLDEIAREGARRMLMEALRAEADDYVERHRGERDAVGRALVVRNGRAQPRKLTLGAGTVELKAPRVDDRRHDEQGERQRFSSRILPPYMRRSPEVAEVLPIHCRRGHPAPLEIAQQRFPALGALPIAVLEREQFRGGCRDRGSLRTEVIIFSATFDGNSVRQKRSQFRASALSYFSTTGYRIRNDSSDNLSGSIRLDYHLDENTVIRSFARYTRANVNLANYSNCLGIANNPNVVNTGEKVHQ